MPSPSRILIFSCDIFSRDFENLFTLKALKFSFEIKWGKIQKKGGISQPVLYSVALHIYALANEIVCCMPLMLKTILRYTKLLFTTDLYMLSLYKAMVRFKQNEKKRAN